MSLGRTGHQGTMSESSMGLMKANIMGFHLAVARWYGLDGFFVQLEGRY